MSDKLLGSDINPKATVQAKTDMSENYELSDGFNPFDYIERPKPENLEVSVGDALKAATTSGLRSVQGIFEIPNQINHSSTEKAYMQRVPEELRAKAKPTPFEDKRKSLSNIAVDKLGEWADSVQDTMSSDAQKAMHTPFYRDGEVSSDPAVWGIQFANLVGYMAPTVATMIATRKVPIDSLAPNIKSLMLRSGVSAEMAEKALPHTLNAIKNAPALGVGVASDVGSQGVQAREMLLNASHEQLMQSPTYIQAFRDIHADPENAGLSNEQKFELAKERVSNIASQDTMTDPKTIAASVLATGFGDVALSRAVLSGTAKSAGGLRGAATGFLKGGTKEGGLEFGQEYTTQRVSNEISNKHAGTNLDLDSGAMDAGINGLIGGFAMGGGMGAAGGLRSAQPTNQDMPEHNEVSVDQNAVDVSATADLENEQQAESKPSSRDQSRVQWGYTKEEAIDDLDAPAYLREELRNQEGPQPQHEASIDPNDLDTPAYMRQGKTINTDPNAAEQQQQTDNLPAVSDIKGEWIGADEQQDQPQAEQPASIGYQQQPRLKGENIIYGDAPVRKPVDDHMEQQTSAPQFNNGEQVKGSVFMPREQSTELQPVGDVKPQVVIDGEYYTVERNGAGTQLVPSDARPSVIYGRDTRPEQDTTIYDKQVGYPQFENGISKNKLRQLKYLANRISEKIPLAMQKLKGAARFTRPEYRTRLVSLADEATSLGNSKTINTQIDSISDAITKLGGISRTIAESEGLDPAAFKRNRLFPATSGRSFDDLAESLNEYGYTNRSGGQLTANDVLDLVDGEVNSGERHFSAQSDMLSETEQGSALVDLVREYGAERVQAAIGKALTGGRLGDRQAEIVNEAMDVIETGRIEQAGGIEYRRAEREARRDARIAKRKQQMDDAVMDLDFPSWVTDEVTAQTESEYNETIEAVLNTAVDHATAANPVAAEALLDQYEAGQITTASLIEQLGALDYADQQKLRDVEKFKPATEGADYSSDASGIGEGQANSSEVNRGGNRSDGVSAEQSTEQSVGRVPKNSARSYRQNEGAEVGNDIAVALEQTAKPTGIDTRSQLSSIDFASLRKEIRRLGEDPEWSVPGRTDHFNNRLGQAEDMASGRSPVNQEIADWAIKLDSDFKQEQQIEADRKANQQQVLAEQQRQHEEKQQQEKQTRQEQLSKGNSDNEREQAYLDTLEEPSNYDKASYATWIAKRSKEYKQASGISGDIGQSDGFTAFIRDYADNNLASRLQPSQSGTTTSNTTLLPKDFDQQNTKDLKSGAYPLGYHNAITRGIYHDGITQANYLQALNTLIANKDDVIQRLNKYTVPVLRNIVGGWHVADMKKPQLVQAAWKRLLETYNFNAGDVTTETVDMSYFSLSAEEKAKIAADKETAMVEQLRQTTQADLDAYLAKRNEQKAEREAEKKAEEEVLENPVTLQDYRKLVSKKGIGALTPEQRATFDQLVTDEELTKRKANEEKQAVKRGFDTDDELDVNPIEKGTHGKTGEPIFNVSLKTRLGTDKFKEAASFARSLKGGYWRGNFFFNSEADAQTFINWLKGDDVDLSANKADKQAEKTMNSTERMEALADRLEESANEVYNRDRKENTSKRMREADHARQQADKDIATAKTFRAIAKGIKDGSIKYLSKLTAKTQLEMLQSLINQARWRAITSDTEHLVYMDQMGHKHWKKDAPIAEKVALVKYPFSEINRENLITIANKMVETKGFVMLGKRILKKERQKTDRMTQLNIDSADTRKIIAFAKANDMLGDLADNFNRLQKLGITTPAMLRTALIELDSVTQQGVEQNANNAKLAGMERNLKRKVITNRNAFVDFFPTPATIATDIVELASIEQGMSVLEPSAGHGMLADAALNAGGDVQTVEMAGDLIDILEAKGHKVDGGDFMEYQPNKMYDRIVMNPPFSNDMDIDHVQRAYEMLKPGGRMVAIVSSMAGNRQNKKNKAFREWLDDLAAEEQMLPDDAFKASLNPTSVRTKTLVIEKPAQGSTKQLESDLIKALLNNTKSKQLENRVAELVDRIKEAGGNWQAVQASLTMAGSESDIKNGISLAAATLKSAGQTLFSRESISPKGNAKGMPLKQAELAVKSWLRQYKGGAMVNVKAVQTQAEAEQILGVSLDGYKVNAFYNEVDATVVVVADNIASTKELRQKLRHEILVHHGLRAVTGDAEYKRVLMTVYTGLESRFLKDLIKQVETDYSRGNLNNFVEEVLAHVAEQDRNQVQKWFDRVVASIAQALRKVGLLAPSDITKAELRNIVETLSDRIKSVNEWSPDNTPPPSGNGVKGHLSRTKFSRTANNSDTSAFQNAVDQARAKLAARMSGPIADTTDGGFDVPTDNIKSTIARKLADKFQVLKELQKNIAKSGGNINEDNDAYLAEELFHGKAENDLRIMKDTFIKPLADKMAQHDISQAQLDEYLIARHAQERNAHIASINPKFPDGGSGMKNADAQAKLSEIKNSGKQQKYDELAHIVDAMIAKQRDVLRDSGLETDEMIDTWQSHYKHYVPLKGLAKDESSLPRTGKGFSIGGKEAKNAMGRKSMAESPSGHAILDLSEKLIRARKNEVGNALLQLVQDNPSNDYWQVFTNENPDTAPQIVERKNPLTGEKEKIVEDRPVPMSMLQDFYFPTKKNGKVYYIKLHDKRLMQAMRNMGPDTSNGIIRFMAGFNRILASVNTSYNPEFVVGNFARDIQTAILNLSAEQTRDDGKIKGEAIARNVVLDTFNGNVVRAIHSSLRGKQHSNPQVQEWQRHFEEFMEVGGKTGWFDMKDVEGQAKELDRMVAMANGSITGKAYKAFENVTGFIENINGSIENAVRLSAYVNARRAGISKKKAASLAKNMTVNFNRRGEVGTTLNAMYMFANASIQGSANFVRTMGSLNGDGKLKWQNLNTAQKIAIGVVAGSFALAFANRSAAGEDDDGVNWFDKVPSYVKERNFVIMKSLLGGKADGSYWSIPMPYGYNIFSVAGSGIEAAVNSDNVTPAQVAGNMALATLGAFSPIGMSSSDTVSGTVLKNALPTLGKPFFEVSTNENFFGGQIYKENMPFGTQLPDSSLSKLSTSEHYKAIASWLNEATGGSAYRSGAIDISPDVMQYITGFFGGAALRFADVKVPGLVQRIAGDEVEDSKVAFLSRISGRVMPYADQSSFYNRRDELMQIKDEIKTINGSDRSAYMKDYGYKLRLLPMLKMTEKQLKALRKRRNAIYALDMPRAQKELRLKSIERQMKKVIDRFNHRYEHLQERD
ncbi:LPD38 domain-containing protein [Photobacterium damselae]|uniref:LPD38 domain-containing protein n=1 Tax=Photobacterium damselae TaxID=38293 RepID=UPI00109BC6CF|nr:LPD38 domain-containing protein [Photobacterium damselae]